MYEHLTLAVALTPNVCDVASYFLCKKIIFVKFFFKKYFFLRKKYFF